MRRVHSVDSQINLLSDSAAPKLEDLGRFTSAVPWRSRVSFQSYALFPPKLTQPHHGMMPPKMDFCFPIQSNHISSIAISVFLEGKKTSSFALSVESWIYRIYKLQVARLQPLYRTLGPTSAARCNSALLPDSFNISRAMVSSAGVQSGGGKIQKLALDFA